MMLARAPDPTPADELEVLAAEVRRLRPDGRNPEPFYEARSEIAGALMRLSRRLAGRPMPIPIPLRRPVPVRAVPVAVAESSSSQQNPTAKPERQHAAAPRSRRTPTRRHRLPLPPCLPSDVQARLL
jgi:hypothetical protein